METPKRRSHNPPTRVVGNPLLSERDGNSLLKRLNQFCLLQSRKPTTLWKRWKLVLSLKNVLNRDVVSETHYSLKEMETFFLNTPLVLWKGIVGNPLLSERDGNRTIYHLSFQGYLYCRKPTTLWKRWKPVRNVKTLHKFLPRSETHYSLKEMETIEAFKVPLLISCTVGNPLLSERDGNIHHHHHR